MKTRGVQNAINRLKGARKFGSQTLLAQAEAEAQHALTRAKLWLLQHADANPAGAQSENYAAMSLAVDELEQTIAAPLALTARVS